MYHWLLDIGISYEHLQRATASDPTANGTQAYAR
jgi:hypothetical protein